MTGDETLSAEEPLAVSGTAPTLSRTDRAAVFLMLLGDDEAAKLLARLDPVQLERIGSAMVALGEIDQAGISEALADFVSEADRDMPPPGIFP